MATSRIDIPVIWSADTRLHEPRHEVWVGKETTGTEVPARVGAILDAMKDRRLVAAETHSRAALYAVHDRALVTHLATAAERWEAGPYAALVGQDRVVPYLFDTPAFTQGMPARPAVAIHADAGRFCYDTMTVLGPGSWAAIRAAADCALTAVDLVLAGEQAVYALSRPPGHHATRGGFGGSCYLNNAALAAGALRAGGHDRVAVIDIDAHHGNGTQSIFWSDPGVLYGSVHVDPAAGWFPHVFGYADELGAGAGRGATHNRPLPEGSADVPWTEAVGELATWVSSAGCTALIVSLGVDAAIDDPESPLQVTADGYRTAGGILGGLGVPTVIVQEGGYHLPTLGTLVAAYLEGHEG